MRRSRNSSLQNQLREATGPVSNKINLCLVFLYNHGALNLFLLYPWFSMYIFRNDRRCGVKVSEECSQPCINAREPKTLEGTVESIQGRDGAKTFFRKRSTEKIATVVTIPEGGQHALVETKLFAGTRQHIHIFEI